MVKPLNINTLGFFWRILYESRQTLTTINTLTIFQWKIWGALVAIGAIGFFVSVVLRLYLLTFE